MMPVEAPSPPRRWSMRKAAAFWLAAILVTSGMLLGVYLLFPCCFRGCELYGPPPTVGLIVRDSGGNWTLGIFSTPAGLLPASTYLQISDPAGTPRLGRTPFSALTEANWTALHALYRDRNPSRPEIAVGDSLVLDGATYRGGYRVEILDDARRFAIAVPG